MKHVVLGSFYNYFISNFCVKEKTWIFVVRHYATVDQNDCMFIFLENYQGIIVFVFSLAQAKCNLGQNSVVNCDVAGKILW